MRWAKPIDEALLLEVATSHDGVIVIEDGAKEGGQEAVCSRILRQQEFLNLRSYWVCRMSLLSMVTLLS